MKEVKQVMAYVLTVMLLLSCIATAQKIEKEFEKSYPFANNGLVKINNYKGDINVETWDKDVVDVYVLIKPDYSSSGTSPEEQIERANVEVKADDDRLKITADYQKRMGNNTLALFMIKVKIPKNCELNIDDYKSTISVKDLNSRLELETYKGDATINILNGSCKIETHKGNIDASIENLTDDCKIENYKGDVDLNMGSSASFKLDAEIGKKGSFRNRFNDEEDYRKVGRDKEYTITNNGAKYRIDCETYKGTIRLNKN